MEPISALQYLSREQLESLVNRLQLEVTHLKQQLGGAEERNHILQYALPQVLRDSLTNAVEQLKVLPSTVTVATSTEVSWTAVVDAYSETDPLPSCHSTSIQTRDEETHQHTSCSVHTQTLPFFIAVKKTDNATQTTLELHPLPVVNANVERSEPDNPIDAIGLRRRKRKSSPSRMREKSIKVIASAVTSVTAERNDEQSTKAVTGVITNLTTDSDSLSIICEDDPLPISTVASRRHKGFITRSTTGLELNGSCVSPDECDVDNHPETADVLLDIDNSVELEENPVKIDDTQMEETPITTCDHSLNTSTQALESHASFQNNGGSLDYGFAHFVPHEILGEIAAQDLARVRQEILANPKITLSKPWHMYKTTNEWTRATCAMMSALFDQDEMANSTVLGRSSTEPRKRLSADRVEFLVATICSQFGVSPAKVRARMAQKCKDERRKRRMGNLTSNFDMNQDVLNSLR